MNLSLLGSSRSYRDDGADVIKGVLLDNGIEPSRIMISPVADMLIIGLKNFDEDVINKTKKILVGLGYMPSPLPGIYDAHNEEIELEFMPRVTRNP